jgi:hypothetical protein
VIFARRVELKSSTVRHKLDLGAVVAVCWKSDSRRELGGAGRVAGVGFSRSSHSVLVHGPKRLTA